MGRQRTIDTGKRDSLGRPIKVSGFQADDYNSTGENGKTINDFSYEDISISDAIGFISYLNNPKYRRESDSSKILCLQDLTNENDKKLWEKSTHILYDKAEELDITDLNYDKAEEIIKKYIRKPSLQENTEIISSARELLGISDNERNFMEINKRLHDDKAKRPRKKKINKDIIESARSLLDEELDEQEKTIFLSITNNDENLSIYPLGGNIYQINYDSNLMEDKDSEKKICLAYFPHGLENMNDYTITDSISNYPPDYRYQVPKNNIFDGLSDNDKRELLKTENSMNAFHAMFHGLEHRPNAPLSDATIDYYSLWDGKNSHLTYIGLNDTDYRELTYYSKFQKHFDNVKNVKDDIRNNYNNDIEAFHAAKHGIVLTGEKSQKKQVITSEYDTNDDENSTRKKKVIEESNNTMNTIQQGIQEGKLHGNIYDVINRYSHSTYHSYYEESLYEGSTDKSFIMRKEWDHNDNKDFDNALKYLEDNTPRNERVLYRLAEIPRDHTVESYSQSLHSGEVMKTMRALSSTMIGKSAIGKLLGDSRKKVVYRYNTTKGVAIANDNLSEVVDEGEVIIPKDSEFVVMGSHYDEKSGHWIIDMIDK